MWMTYAVNTIGQWVNKSLADESGRWIHIVSLALYFLLPALLLFLDILAKSRISQLQALVQAPFEFAASKSDHFRRSIKALFPGRSRKRRFEKRVYLSISQFATRQFAQADTTKHAR